MDSKIDFNAIEEAFKWVTQHAKGEKRNLVFQVENDNLGYYPYWGHLNSVLEQLIVSGVRDELTLISGILHDIVEDHGVTLKQIEDQFGKGVMQVVDLCTKPNDENLDSDAYYSRITDSVQVDELIRTSAMKVKVCDRITNLIGVQFTNDTSRKRRYVEETRKYFLPMAKKVGMSKQLKNALDFLLITQDS